ncbi:hypothetical protein R3P38DRAFT_2759392 [Favolaschia claudopus]|uniref:Uncharacterized protein n=1 Tax=Favolaschia claudopus TaxID=2862362 RepID=A0AAW0E9C5_9AGAR
MSSALFGGVSHRIQQAATLQPAWKSLVLVTVALLGLTVILYIQQNTSSSLGSNSLELHTKNSNIPSVLGASAPRDLTLDQKGKCIHLKYVGRLAYNDGNVEVFLMKYSQIHALISLPVDRRLGGDANKRMITPDDLTTLAYVSFHESLQPRSLQKQGKASPLPPMAVLQAKREAVLFTTTTKATAQKAHAHIWVQGFISILNPHDFLPVPR